MWFALSWIIAYVVLFSIADNFSAVLGFEKIVTAPVCVVFTLILFGWVKRSGRQRNTACILTHSVVNGTSIFSVPSSQTLGLLTSAVMCVVSVGYALYILKRTAIEEK